MTPPDQARWRAALVRWQAAQALFAEATGPWVDVAIAELHAAGAVLSALAHERERSREAGAPEASARGRVPESGG